MNILLCDCFGSFQMNDVKSCFEKLGHNCVLLFYLLKNREEDDAFEEILQNKLNSGNFDFVFSTNFYPIIATICRDKDIVYVTWSYATRWSVACCPLFLR